ncbi:hypothetical protein LB503_009003 [Fusarium chuoi]|nr:hypothetical protein LB503_009003 [Fusarium chuoi]
MDQKMDLIKTVRGLDQNGPGEDGKNLEKLWKSLTVSADSQFHAVEESSLRWLLKSMNGASKDAETLRRWPLTWTILESNSERYLTTSYELINQFLQEKAVANEELRPGSSTRYRRVSYEWRCFTKCSEDITGPPSFICHAIIPRQDRRRAYPISVLYLSS